MGKSQGDEMGPSRFDNRSCSAQCRYQSAWNVFGVDLKNEPHDAATWGDGNLRTDWRLAAQRLGNAILASRSFHATQMLASRS